MEHYKNRLSIDTPLIPDLVNLVAGYIGWEIGECLHFTLPCSPERVQLGRVASYCIDTKKGVIERLLIRFKHVKDDDAFNDLMWISLSDVVPRMM